MVSRYDAIACLSMHKCFTFPDSVGHGALTVLACVLLTEILLAAVQRQDMVEGVRATASAAASQGRMEWGAAKSMLKAYERLLDSYTYLSL